MNETMTSTQTFLNLCAQAGEIHYNIKKLEERLAFVYSEQEKTYATILAENQAKATVTELKPTATDGAQKNERA